jgi:preprotein translocase subunit SecG
VLPVVLVVHIATCLVLIFLVLLHSGRGGGLSDMFGGGLGASAAGSTVVEKNLDRLTVVAGVVFTFSSVALALLIDK